MEDLHIKKMLFFKGRYVQFRFSAKTLPKIESQLFTLLDEKVTKKSEFQGKIEEKKYIKGKFRAQFKDFQEAKKAKKTSNLKKNFQEI